MDLPFCPGEVHAEGVRWWELHQTLFDLTLGLISPLQVGLDHDRLADVNVRCSNDILILTDLSLSLPPLSPSPPSLSLSLPSLSLSSQHPHISKESLVKTR